MSPDGHIPPGVIFISVVNGQPQKRPRGQTHSGYVVTAARIFQCVKVSRRVHKDLVDGINVKKSNFNDFSDQYIKNVAKKLKLSPRKKLIFSNPKTEFFKQLANFALAR